ncbi:MAG TPA: hypothetical protein VF613_00420 [Longimicrobium sp.]|jgi:hypothetical protein
MTFRIGPRTHLGETDLLRYLDHQLDREAHRRARIHLGQCADCSAQLAELERRSATVRAMIGELPVELPDPGKRALALAAMDRTRVRRSATGPLSAGMVLRAAVIATLALLATLSTQSGRAWVSDRVEAVAGDNPGPLAEGILRVLDGAPEQPRRTPATASARREEAVHAHGSPSTPEQRVSVQRRNTLPPGATAPVQFTPNGPEVVIRFQTLQRGGSATLWLREVREATAHITSGHRTETIVPIEGGVRVSNRTDSRAHYVLTVPVHFRMVRVQVGDGPETLIPVSKSKRNWIWTISLQETITED